MGSDFTNFPDGCHGPVPLRGLFRGRTSRKRSRTINQSQARESTGFQFSPPITYIARILNDLISRRQAVDVAPSEGLLHAVAQRE